MKQSYINTSFLSKKLCVTPITYVIDCQGIIKCHDVLFLNC